MLHYHPSLLTYFLFCLVLSFGLPFFFCSSFLSLFLSNSLFLCLLRYLFLCPNISQWPNHYATLLSPLHLFFSVYSCLFYFHLYLFLLFSPSSYLIFYFSFFTSHVISSSFQNISRWPNHFVTRSPSFPIFLLFFLSMAFVYFHLYSMLLTLSLSKFF